MNDPLDGVVSIGFITKLRSVHTLVVYVIYTPRAKGIRKRLTWEQLFHKLHGKVSQWSS